MFELIVTDNPFKVLLTDSNKFKRERKPGEQPENKTQEIDFVIRYCSNGHSFFVKKCQSYHKEIKCPDPWCNALIKKVDTTPNTQTVIEYVDTAKRFFFCFNSENKEDTQQATTVSPLICTLLQLLSCLTLLLRDVGEPQESVFCVWKKAKETFLLLSKMTEMTEEQLCMALHEWLCEFPQWFNKTYPNELSKVNLQSINQFESKIDEKYSQFFKYYKASRFSQKTKSTLSITDYEVKEEHTLSDRSISQMFLEIRLVSSTDLLYKFYNKPELVSAYPLLFNLLKSIDDLEYIKCLPDIGQWMKHCHIQFSGKLTQKQHNEMTVSSVINDCSNTKLEKHWHQFVKGWNRFNDRKLDIESIAMTVPMLSQDHKRIYQQ
ncbi:hypothetical protein RFI_37983 [Reticulomyxa filosa]|uniref:Uncharacterized protein n=1 Tax=Reticulomyxa filosa TaxID=46433 RepID=X6LBV7_RETFI|nr:hypothetical protein RFI_37983 [Reticulomyxa filosa]|eukprot:ETN99487.1 hypothetical protein RFI_37983 [Reticulomyxa filosa]